MELKLKSYGFKEVDRVKERIPNCSLLLKKQTINYNRVVCFVSLDELPNDLDHHLKKLRIKVAFSVGFIPIIWGVGLQVVLDCPGITRSNYDPKNYVATIDNQWAIIQSVFFVDGGLKEFVHARSWGQVITGTYQDAILEELNKEYVDVT